MGGASTAVLVLLVAVVSAAAAVLVPIHAEDKRPFGRASQLSQPDTLVEDGRSLAGCPGPDSPTARACRRPISGQSERRLVFTHVTGAGAVPQVGLLRAPLRPAGASCILPLRRQAVPSASPAVTTTMPPLPSVPSVAHSVAHLPTSTPSLHAPLVVCPPTLVRLGRDRRRELQGRRLAGHVSCVMCVGPDDGREIRDAAQPGSGEGHAWGHD